MTTYTHGYMKTRSERSVSERNRGHAAMQPVVMPCCGTTRLLHDDIGPGPVLRTCTKCETRWHVTYLGEGKFRFKRVPKRSGA